MKKSDYINLAAFGAFLILEIGLLSVLVLLVIHIH